VGDVVPHKGASPPQPPSVVVIFGFGIRNREDASVKVFTEATVYAEDRNTVLIQILFPFQREQNLVQELPCLILFIPNRQIARLLNE
jgi:hypothetical protein